jgi:membrane protein
MMWMWMWMSAIIVLYGAELNSEIERRTGAGSTSGAAEARSATVTR